MDVGVEGLRGGGVGDNRDEGSRGWGRSTVLHSV